MPLLKAQFQGKNLTSTKTKLKLKTPPNLAAADGLPHAGDQPGGDGAAARRPGHTGGIQNTEYRIQSTEYRIQHTEYRIQNTESNIQNTKYRIQNTEYRIQNTKYR